MRLKKRNSLSELEKELTKLYEQGYKDGVEFQSRSVKATSNYRIHPVDRATKRIINLMKFD